MQIIFGSGTVIPIRFENGGFHRKEKAEKLKQDQYIPIRFENSVITAREKTEKPEQDQYKMNDWGSSKEMTSKRDIFEIIKMYV